MKTIILSISLLTIAWFSPVNAQDKDVKDAPAKVKSEFSKLYPNVKDVKWHLEDGNYEGKFTTDKMDMSVQISEKGELVQKEMYLKIAQLPKAVQDYLTKNYAGTKFNEASEVTNVKNVKHYQVETKEKVLIFDSKGTFVKAEKNDDD
jgi:hypothetical protein